MEARKKNLMQEEKDIQAEEIRGKTFGYLVRWECTKLKQRGGVGQRQKQDTFTLYFAPSLDFGRFSKGFPGFVTWICSCSNWRI